MSQEKTETKGETSPETHQGQGAPAKKGRKPKAEKAPKEPKPPRVKKEKPVRPLAHLSKVEKVASQLPVMTQEAQAIFVGAANLSTPDISSLVAHLNIVMRKRSVVAIAQGAARAGETPLLTVGQRVRIRSGQGGSARFIGHEGTVTKVQRIRCYVAIDGRTYDPKRLESGQTDYFFISDIETANGTGLSLQDALQRLTSQAPPVDINTLVDEDEDVETTVSDEAANG